MGIELSRFRRMVRDFQSASPISANSRANDHEDMPVPELPSKPETQPDRMYNGQELRTALAESLKTLPGRYQKVVLFYYTNQMTMREIGDALGINESRVSQIHKAALEKLCAALQSNGIHSPQAFSV
jgi:RNA polymerase sigma factor for flagellar operon FliA